MSLKIVTQPAQAAAAAIAKGASEKDYLSYEGQVPNLKGLEVLAEYQGGQANTRWLTIENTQFYTNPPYAAGVIGYQRVLTDGVTSGADGDYAWAAMRNYDLMLNTADGVKNLGTVTIRDVVPISRSDLWKVRPGVALPRNYPFNDDAFVLWDSGVDFQGPLGDEVYIDDTPDLSKYSLQVTYADGSGADIPVRWDTPWQIRSLYEELNVSGPGQLLASIGSNPLGNAPNTTSASAVHPYVQTALIGSGTTASPDLLISPKLINNGRYADPGIVAPKTIKTVHIVAREGVTLTVDGGMLDDFFYWMKDDSQAWIDRILDKNGTMEVKYTDGKTKTITVKEALHMNTVWHNVSGANMPDPNNKVPFGVFGVQEMAARQTGTGANAGRPVAYTRNTDPMIEIDYRGGVQKIPMPVFTRALSLEITAKDPEWDGYVDMRQRDNDVGGMNATEFAKTMNVVAIFSSPTDPGEHSGRLPLKFDELRYTGTTQNDGAYVGNAGASAAERPYTLRNWKTGGKTFVGVTDPIAYIGDDYYAMDFGKPAWYGQFDTSTPPLTAAAIAAAGFNNDPKWQFNWGATTVGGTIAATSVGAPSYDPYSLRNPSDPLELLPGDLLKIPAYGPCNNPRNNGNTTAVTFYYKAPVFDKDPTSPEYYEYLRTGITTSSVVRQSQAVTWKNINTR